MVSGGYAALAWLDKWCIWGAWCGVRTPEGAVPSASVIDKGESLQFGVAKGQPLIQFEGLNTGTMCERSRDLLYYSIRA